MFFGYEYQLLTLFAIVFVKIECGPKAAGTEDEDSSLEYTKSTRPTTTIKMDDLKFFNMSYYCKLQPNIRVCDDRRISRKYFFDIKLQRCVQFEYRNCNNSYNMFDNKHVCRDACRDEVHSKISDDVTFNVFCRYQPDFGDCNSYHPMFYFDMSDGKCKGFAYSGCGGNQNRFRNTIKCLDTCGLLVTNNYQFQ